MSENSRKKIKKPWPTKAAMEQIYENNLWGGAEGEFYSGIGSHHSGITDPYIEKISSFLRSFDYPLVICDLGCGDFNIGSKLVKYTSRYHAIDIVPKLIDRNMREFQDEKLEFHCLDIAKDSLPAGDCAIIRQVLQHLSNKDIRLILSKLNHFKYIILTEHVPDGDFKPNADIITGQGIRLKKQSGVDLLAPPFNFEVKEERLLMSVGSDDGEGVLKTILYKTL